MCLRQCGCAATLLAICYYKAKIISLEFQADKYYFNHLLTVNSPISFSIKYLIYQGFAPNLHLIFVLSTQLIVY